MIGSLDMVVLDCPDPEALADFYAELLGMTRGETEPDWVEIVSPGNGRPIVAFQKVESYRAPEWPGQLVPQQVHFDVKVPDLDEGERQILALGAVATGSGGQTYRVYLDPAGHPFCLVNPSD